MTSTFKSNLRVTHVLYLLACCNLAGFMYGHETVVYEIAGRIINVRGDMVTINRGSNENVIQDSIFVSVLLNSKI